MPLLATPGPPVTVYSEMLKMALDHDRSPAASVDEQVKAAMARRAELQRATDLTARLAHALAYDAALVRLCDSLGVAHSLTDEQAGPTARTDTERALAEWIPAFTSLGPLEGDKLP